MLDSFSIFEELTKTFDEKSAKALTKTLSKIYYEIANVVTKEEFRELKTAIAELTEAQKNTENKINQLAEAQKKTEQRLDELTERVNQLAEAQKKTEQRLDELAKAQKKTEEVVKGLLKDMTEVKERLEGLSDTVGYGLEDKLIPLMPAFVKNKYNAEVIVVDRRNIVYPNGKFDEINIYIEAMKNNQKFLIIGESKAKPGKRDIKKFLKLKERLSKYTEKEVKCFIVGYTFHPEVENYLKKTKELDYFKTFEIERIANNSKF